MFKEMVNKGLDFLFKKFESELEGLQEDLEELAKNRKHNFVEAETILTIDGYLDFIIERMMGFALDGSIPVKYQAWAMEIIERARGVRDFIYDNFEDVFRGTYKPETA